MHHKRSLGPMHGLPRELEKARVAEWPAVLDYLDALTKCDRPIVVQVTDDRVTHGYLTQLGYLRNTGAHPVETSFAVDWPERGQLKGSVHLYEQLFDNATLSTADGDDYFWFHISFGSLTILFEDSNRW